MSNKNKGIAPTSYNIYMNDSKSLLKISHMHYQPSHTEGSLSLQTVERAKGLHSWAGRLWKKNGCRPKEAEKLLMKENLGRQADGTPVKYIFSPAKN